MHSITYTLMCITGGPQNLLYPLGTYSVNPHLRAAKSILAERNYGVAQLVAELNVEDEERTDAAHAAELAVGEDAIWAVTAAEKAANAALNAEAYAAARAASAAAEDERSLAKFRLAAEWHNRWHPLSVLGRGASGTVIRLVSHTSVMPPSCHSYLYRKSVIHSKAITRVVMTNAGSGGRRQVL